MPRYRKRPIVIDVVRLSDVYRLPPKGREPWVEEALADGRLRIESERSVLVRTKEGPLTIEDVEGGSTWWIASGIEGELYPIADSVFERTFVEESDPHSFAECRACKTNCIRHALTHDYLCMQCDNARNLFTAGAPYSDPVMQARHGERLLMLTRSPKAPHDVKLNDKAPRALTRVTSEGITRLPERIMIALGIATGGDVSYVDAGDGVVVEIMSDDTFLRRAGLDEGD